MEKYLIIGNGVAATACIEGIRSCDKNGEITVISKENNFVYCRPLISYYLEDKTDEKRMMYRKDDFYDKMACKVIYGKKAEQADEKNKTVTLDDGTVLPYTKLCVASGSSPFVPHFEGLETVSQKFSFMTLDDAKQLKKAVNKDSRVLIIGAGLIGLKCAEGLIDSAKSICICDLADRVLSSILDTEGSEIVMKHLQEKGLNFMLSDSVEKFNGNSAIMKSGKVAEFDILVLAVGVRATTETLKNTSAEINRGIIVNDKMETGAKDIYACGDCTEGFDVSLGAKRILALMPNAYHQGFCAGVNMAGGDKKYDCAIPMNSLGLLGMHIMTAGTFFDEEHGGSLYHQESEGRIKKLYIKDGVMSGFMLIGDIDRAGIYTAMVRNRTPINSVNFDILKKTPVTALFSEEKRKNIFGAVV